MTTHSEFRHARRALRPLAGVLLGVLLLAGCAPDPGLRVEDPGVPAPTVTASEPAGPPDEPFSAGEVREAIISANGPARQQGMDQVHEVLLVCSGCLRLHDPFIAGGQKFQIAMVSTPSDQQLFAGVVVSEEDGEPEVNLIVSGHDLTLTPGRGGTLVAQESTYRERDPECCPSGWSVRVYRYHDGRFEAGQRISQNSGN
ncbi:hypothetical protein [Brevibacterium daeguense]|uniref:hypothetical protein n=1 Tax=Brevibacterium daeguense TaxID=909936 RepID=UPI001F385632|nr:hypothetical protein [Brevibacterium daeguense]